MATERDFELLDDYLSNRMETSEKASFEQKLNADPDLQHEYSLQQSLLTGIISARKLELKTMLNNTPIPAPNHGGNISISAKVVLGTFIAAIVATGIYLYWNKIEDSDASAPVEETTSTTKGETIEELNVQQDKKSSTPETQVIEPKDQQVMKKEQPLRRKASEEAISPVHQPVLDVFDPTEEAEESTAPSDESARTSGAKAGSSMAVEVEKHHRNFSFHYQVRDGKLFLYGPFEKNLYEIMEFFSEEKRTIFLYYKDGYYLIEENLDKIRPLNAITDQTLISRLKEYRGN